MGLEHDHCVRRGLGLGQLGQLGHLTPDIMGGRGTGGEERGQVNVIKTHFLSVMSHKLTISDENTFVFTWIMFTTLHYIQLLETL